MLLRLPQSFFPEILIEHLLSPRQIPAARRSQHWAGTHGPRLHGRLAEWGVREWGPPFTDPAADVGTCDFEYVVGTF